MSMWYTYTRIGGLYNLWLINHHYRVKEYRNDHPMARNSHRITVSSSTAIMYMSVCPYVNKQALTGPGSWNYNYFIFRKAPYCGLCELIHWARTGTHRADLKKATPTANINLQPAPPWATILFSFSFTTLRPRLKSPSFIWRPERFPCC